MEPDGSLPRLKVPATCPYPEPDQSITCPPHQTNLKYHVPFPLLSSYQTISPCPGTCIRIVTRAGFAVRSC